jgi:hypothetical protein
MGYRTDQWYDLTNVDKTGESLTNVNNYKNKSGYYLPDADNDRFLYPDRIVRTGTNNIPGNRKLEFLKRGYIRSLQTAENKMGLAPRKCQFQFNPQFLVQSVSQNTTILNFLQQDPGQYAQPIPGNVSFSFELFFDRSMELNNKGAVPTNPSSTGTASATSPWSRSPYEVGVLHDIDAFYSVIGVGLSEQMMTYAQKTLETQINAAAYSANEQASESGEDGPTYDESDLSDLSSRASDFLKYNFGNTAFLLPLPVRVVFSSLYIVEGLVKDVTVTFTKFNSAMVPMQCTLNVLFEAKYVGFANKDTFFTQVLEDYENLDPTSFTFDTDIDPEELRAYKEAITSDLSQSMLLLAFSDNDDSGRAISYYKPGSSNLVTDTHSLTSVVSNASKGLTTTQARDIEGNNYYFKVGFPNAKSSSRLVQLADSGKDVSLDVEARYSLWRWSKDVHEELLPEWNAARVAGAADELGIITSGYSVLQNSITGPGSPSQQSAGRTFFRKLWDWTASSELPTTFITEDDGGDDQAFGQVIRVSSAELNQSTLITKAKDSDDKDVEISLPSTGVVPLERAFNAGYTTKATVTSNGGTYDKSVERTGYEKNKIPQYRTDDGSEFYFGFEYEVQVTVTIDGNEFPAARIVDHILIPTAGYGTTDSTGSGTYLTNKLVNIDWSSSFGDIDELIDEALEEANEENLNVSNEMAQANIDSGAAGI